MNRNVVDVIEIDEEEFTVEAYEDFCEDLAPGSYALQEAIDNYQEKCKKLRGIFDRKEIDLLVKSAIKYGVICVKSTILDNREYWGDKD